MPYEILIQELAAGEIGALRPFDQRRVIDEIEGQLSHQPNVPTRRRKCLIGLAPEFEHVLPVWELRAGEFRIFYDIEEQPQRVYVRAVRRKTPLQQTKDIT
jgi:mRNA-degrading endonuclease RelE of RelBE toxin-antitoxin system